MLSFEEKQEVLLSFPNIKLCYDNIKHNKVNNNEKTKFDICLAIPCGKKCFAWFTQYKNKNVCLLLDLGKNKNIYDIKIVNCVFKNELVYGEYGTIFYGTMFHNSSDKCTNNKLLDSFFSVEDIFYWKGNNVNKEKWLNKYHILLEIFKNEVKQVTYNKNFVVFGLPLISTNLTELKKIIGDIKYKIYDIHLQLFNDINLINTISYNSLDSYIIKNNNNNNNNNILLQSQPKQLYKTPLTQYQCLSQNISYKVNNLNSETNKKKTEVVFNIKPDIQNDIYNLYCIENNQEVFYNIAYIPDYKTSVMMNKIFRNIKENDNLDLLEESDDEEEFQNENIDRFVNMNKSLLMICKYNYKFKKWYPIKEFLNMNCNINNDIIVKQSELINYEKTNQKNTSTNTNTNTNTNTKFIKRF